LTRARTKINSAAAPASSAQDSLYKRQTSRAGEALAQVGLADHASAKVDKLPPGLVRRAYDLPLEPLDTPTNCFRAHRVAW